MRLTLRTLLAYLDDTLAPAEARQIGLKVAENPQAQELVERIRRVTRRRGLSTPPTGNEGSPSDPNTVAEYLSDALPADQVAALDAASEVLPPYPHTPYRQQEGFARLAPRAV